MAAQKTITQRIAFEGGPEIKAQLDALGVAGEQAFAKIKNAADRTRGIGDNLTRDASTLQGKLSAVGDVAQSTGAALVAAFRAPAVEPFSRALTTGQVAGAKFGAAMRELGTQFGLVGRNVAGLDTPFSRFMSTLRNVAIVAAGVGAAKGLSNFIKSAGEGATETENFARSVGLSVDEYTKYRSAARQAGVDEESFRRGLAKINEEFVSARDNGAETSDVFKKLGAAGDGAGSMVVNAFGGATRNVQSADQVYKSFLGTLDQGDRPTIIAAGNVRTLGDQQFNAGNAVKFLADRLKGIEDPAKRAALVTQILGARQQQWTGFLERGSAGIADLTTKSAAFDSGAQKRVAILSTMNLSLQRVQGTSKKLKEEFIALFAPNITALADKFAASISANWDKIVAATKPLADAIGGALDSILQRLNADPGAAVAALETVSTTLAEIGKAAGIVGSIVSATFQTVVFVLNSVADLLNFITNAINNGLGTALPKVTGATIVWTTAIVSLVGGFGLLMSAINAARVVVGIFFSLLAANPFTLLLAAIAAVAAVLLLNFGPQIWATITAAWQAGLTALASVWQGIKDGVAAAGTFIVDTFNSTVQSVVGFFNGLWDSIVAVFNRIVDKARSVASAVVGAFAGSGGQW